MRRTQISLTDDDRRLLDAVSERTGLSLAALIRAAVHATYADDRPAQGDLDALRKAFGSWQPRDREATEWVGSMRSGRRLAAGR